MTAGVAVYLQRNGMPVRRAEADPLRAVEADAAGLGFAARHPAPDRPGEDPHYVPVAAAFHDHHFELAASRFRAGCEDQGAAVAGNLGEQDPGSIRGQQRSVELHRDAGDGVLKDALEAPVDVVPHPNGALARFVEDPDDVGVVAGAGEQEKASSADAVDAQVPGVFHARAKDLGQSLDRPRKAQLLGQRAGLPVYSLLGGRTREGAMAYTHCDGSDRYEVEENIRAAQAKGFKAFRAQVGIKRWQQFSSNDLADWDATSPERWEPYAYLQELPDIIEHLRVTLGTEPLLVHDVHHRLNSIQAARLAKSLEPYELLFLEDPIHPEHVESLRLLRQHSTIPVGLGELLTNRWQFLPLLADQLIDFVRCDIAHIGGITEARKIAILAETYNAQVALHAAPDTAPIVHAANLHLDLAIPNFGAQEMCTFPEEAAEVFQTGISVTDGYLNLTDAPGLGVEVDQAVAARYPYQTGYLPTMRRADASVHDW